MERNICQSLYNGQLFLQTIRRTPAKVNTDFILRMAVPEKLLTLLTLLTVN